MDAALVVPAAIAAQPIAAAEVPSPPPSSSLEADMTACIALVRQRDRSALRTLYLVFKPRVHACAMRILRREELAEEVVSACFLQAWNDAATFDIRRGPVLAWLLIIARSRAIDLLRRCHTIELNERAVEPDELELLAAPDDDDAVTSLDRERRRVVLQRFLLELSAVQRQVITLTTMRGLTHEQASMHLGMPLGTLKSHVRRGLDVLRRRCLASGSTFAALV